MPTFDLLRYKLTLNFMFLLPLASFSSSFFSAEYYTIVFFFPGNLVYSKMIINIKLYFRLVVVW